MIFTHDTRFWSGTNTNEAFSYNELIGTEKDESMVMIRIGRDLHIGSILSFASLGPDVKELSR